MGPALLAADHDDGGGIGHHPDESVLAEDVDVALAAGAHFLKTWKPA